MDRRTRPRFAGSLHDFFCPNDFAGGSLLSGHGLFLSQYGEGRRNAELKTHRPSYFVWIKLVVYCWGDFTIPAQTILMSWSMPVDASNPNMGRSNVTTYS